MRIWTAIALAWSVAALAPAGDASAQEIDRYKIITECTDTINRYAHTRDQLDAEAHAALFTEDGVFETGGAPAVGRQAIAQRLRDADPNAMTRHLSSSIVVSVEDGGDITADSYFYVLQAARPSPPRPVAVGSYLMVEYHDEMRMTDNGCQIAKRAFNLIFIGQN